MNVSQTQIKQFAAFLESMSEATPNKALMNVIKQGFKECYPINEGVGEAVMSFFKGHVPEDKLQGFSKAIATAMEKSGMDNVGEFVKKALKSQPKQEFVNAAQEFFNGKETPITEGIGDKVSKLIQVLAVSAMLASNAVAGGNLDEYEEVVGEDIVEDIEDGKTVSISNDNIPTIVQMYVDNLMKDKKFERAMETEDDVKSLVSNHPAYKQMVAQFNATTKSDPNIANAFARGINRALKTALAADAPLIGQQRSN